jgi:hypothetical protein
MKIVKRSLLLLAVVFGAASVYAQSADDIIAKYIDATGGKEKLSAINSVVMQSSIEVMGNEAPSTTTILNGKGYRNESDFNGQKIVQVVTDKGGWGVNPLAGNTDPQPLPDEQYKASQDQIYVVPFLDYAARGEKAEFEGQEKVGDVNAYKVKFTNKDGVATTYYFDPSTYYIIKTSRSSEMMGQQLDLTVTSSDYQPTDYGWVAPRTIEFDFGGQFSMTIKVQKIDVNQPVDASIFEMKN